jgi:hypothetical protein
MVGGAKKAAIEDSEKSASLGHLEAVSGIESEMAPP